MVQHIIHLILILVFWSVISVLFIMQNTAFEPAKHTARPSWKLIRPGNHTNIPPPESRIGPNDERGYIHNPNFLNEGPKPFSIPEDLKQQVCLPPGKGLELPEGYAALRKIRNHIEISQGDRNVKLFCALYTYSGGISKTAAISETWGRKCDGLLFASDISNLETGHVHLPSNSPAGFSYDGMVQRTRTILVYLYDNFLGDFDFFHISGDDIFLIVENLKEFLASDKVKEWDGTEGKYALLGFIHQHHKYPNREYLAGGSGYTMSKKMLKAYVEGPLQTCDPGREGSQEDVAISECAQKLTEHYFIDSRDAVGAHRYHQCPVQELATFPTRKWGLSTMVFKNAMQYQEKKYGYPVVYKDEYISNSSVAFHRISAAEMRRYEIFLYLDGYAECGGQFIP